MIWLLADFLFETKYKVFFRMIVLSQKREKENLMWDQLTAIDMGQVDQLILQQNKPVGVD